MRLPSTCALMLLYVSINYILSITRCIKGKLISISLYPPVMDSWPVLGEVHFHTPIPNEKELTSLVCREGNYFGGELLNVLRNYKDHKERLKF